MGGMSTLEGRRPGSRTPARFSQPLAAPRISRRPRAVSPVLTALLAVGLLAGPLASTALAQEEPAPDEVAQQDAAEPQGAEEAPAPPPPAEPPPPPAPPTDKAPEEVVDEAAVTPAEAEPPVAPVAEEETEAKKAIYIAGDFAFSYGDLGALSDKLSFDKTSASGVLYGLSGGLRLKDFRIGARWRVQDTSEFTLWSFALQAGYALPIRPITPIFSAHVGYVFDQQMERALIRSSLPEGTIMAPDVDVKGLLAGVDVNASYWVTRFLRLGVFVGADLTFLNREKVAAPRTIFGASAADADHPLFAGSGSGTGLSLNAGIRGAFDIGLE